MNLFYKKKKFRYQIYTRGLSNIILIVQRFNQAEAMKNFTVSIGDNNI